MKMFVEYHYPLQIARLLIYTLKCPLNGEVILELDRHILACERLEDAEDELHART